MTEISDREFEQFLESRRRRLEEVGHSEPESMTRLAGTMEFFRTMPYPCTPERETEIERIHQDDRKRAEAEHRAQLIAFAVECLDGKRGATIEALAVSTLKSVHDDEYIVRGAGNQPENLINLVLWDLRRQVAWINAKARGDTVPRELKTREECLAIYNARKVADENWADNEAQSGSRIPPMNPAWSHPDPRLPVERDDYEPVFERGGM